MSTKLGKAIEISLTDGYTPVRFPALNNETCINLFEFEGGMIPTPGYTRLLPHLSGKEARGIFYSDILNTCIIVIDNILYSVTLSTIIELGRLNTNTGKVYFAENGLNTKPDESEEDPGGQIVISDNLHIYIYTLDNVFQIAKNDENDVITFIPGTLVYQNSFFLINDLNSNRIYASNINDARIFPVLNWALTSSRTRSCIGFKNLLYVFTKDTTSIFYSSPSEPAFPYEIDTSRSWEYGCLAIGSVASSQGIICWLGNTRYGNSSLLVSSGGDPSSFATPGINSLINSFEVQNDAEGFIYKEDGHIFYQINFIKENKSFLYDFYSKKWSKLSDSSGLNSSSIRQTVYYESKNVLVAILKDEGSFNKFSSSIYNYNGNVIPRIIISQNYTVEERPKICNEIDLEIEEGENSGVSKIILSISKDRGRTFPINRVYELGKIGDRKNLIRWYKLGISRWWTFKFSFFSCSRFIIIKATGWFF